MTRFFVCAAATLLTAWSSLAQVQPKLFQVPANQDLLLKEAAIERLKSGHLLQCARIWYGPRYLLDHPLDIAMYSILKPIGPSMTSDSRNSLSLLNDDGSKWFCESLNGYCMSLSAWARDANLLMMFDPQATDPAVAALKDPQARYEYFEKIIFDLWMYKKPVVIRGFESLNHFTSDPAVQNVFRAAIPKNWGDLATIPQIGIGVLFKSRKPMEQAAIRDAVTELLLALGRNHNPLVYLGAKKTSIPWSPPDLPEGFESPNMRLMTPSSLAPEPDAAGFDLFPAIDWSQVDPRIYEELLRDPSLGLQEGVAASEGGIERLSAVKKAVDGIRDTYIHVTQLTSVVEEKPGVKWVLHFIDPNGKAPANVGKLMIDLEAEHPLIFQGATTTRFLDAFGLLPGDRQHMDEIVLNLTEWAETQPQEYQRLMQQKARIFQSKKSLAGKPKRSKKK